MPYARAPDKVAGRAARHKLECGVLYAHFSIVAFDFVTNGVRASGRTHRYLRVPPADLVPATSAARIGAVWYLPVVLLELGIGLGEMLEAAGVRPDIFDDRDNAITYPELGRLLQACEDRIRCEHVALLVCQRSRLADLGLPGQVALCSRTAGEALRRFADHFNLQSSASIIGVSTSGAFAHVVYANSEPGLTDTRHLQLGAITILFNTLQDLCGAGWSPAVVTFASRGPADPRPLQRFFRAPLRFDSEESALVFDRQWLDRPLEPVDRRTRREVAARVRARRRSILADFPATVRRILRREMLVGECTMEQVAARLTMHRRTLDRHLRRHGVQYGALLASVKKDVARQLLSETDMQVQQIAATLQYSSAANFATAFRRWTGDTPSAYRRGPPGSATERYRDRHQQHPDEHE